MSDRRRRLLALFVLGLFLFSYPALQLADALADVTFAGLLPVYLFLAWAAVILAAAVAVERSRRE